MKRKEKSLKKNKKWAHKYSQIILPHVWTKKYNTTSNNTFFKTKAFYNKPSKRYIW